MNEHPIKINPCGFEKSLNGEQTIVKFVDMKYVVDKPLTLSASGSAPDLEG